LRNRKIFVGAGLALPATKNPALAKFCGRRKHRPYTNRVQKAEKNQILLFQNIRIKSNICEFHNRLIKMKKGEAVKKQKIFR